MTPAPLTILVLGGYGLIGSAVMGRVQAAGHMPICAGRSAETAARVLPGLPFRFCDMSTLTDAALWAPLLEGVDVVVNCAGALQDGPADDLEALHHHALAALGEAATVCGVRVVQVSAAGAVPEASTRFMASKARGDAALARSGAAHVILRPGLVLARGAYGGTLLLRLLAAVPVAQPLALPETRIQTVALEDLADACLIAATGGLPDGSALDLVEEQSHRLEEVITAHRLALGLRPARWRVVLPEISLSVTGWLADALGRLGWRSPLRRTALMVLRDGVTGDPARWRAQFGPLTPMDKTLAHAGLGAEHRLQARAALLMPAAVAVLALFWTLSGLIGLWQIGPAAAHLTAIDWPDGLAYGSVAFWSVVDIVLAAAVMYRPWAQRACLGMIAVSAIYLGSATVLTPSFWADPLGPMVKVLPAIMLAWITHTLLEPR